MADDSLLRVCTKCKSNLPIDKYSTITRESGLVYYNKKCKACCSKIASANRLKRIATADGLKKDREQKAKWNKDNRHKYYTYPSKRRQKPKPVSISKSVRDQRQAHLERNRLRKREAWKHWLSIATDDWLDNHYSKVVNPWQDHRLSDAEKYRLRYRTDPEFAIKERLRNQLKKCGINGSLTECCRRALKRNGNSPTYEGVTGHSIAELKTHLEKQFTKGMDWDRFASGDIHIDHIVPKSRFDMTNPREVRECWSLSNLQPLWAEDNLKKGAKLEYIC